MNYVIIGASAAGASAAKEIAKNRDESDQILIFTDEAYPFYYRPRLIECLSGEVEVEDIIINNAEWFAEHDIDLHLSEKITEIDLENSLIKSAKNSYQYDKLLFANGSKCFVPPFSGVELDNIFTLKKAADLKEINAAAQQAKKVVVVGGGLLGLEMAYNFNKAGLETTVLEVADYLLPMQLDEKAGDLLESKLQKNNIKVITGAKTKGFTGKKKVEKVILENEEVAADLVLISTGIKCDTCLVEDLDIKTNKGIVVNEKLETSFPNVYAAGDLAEYDNQIYGIWPPALEQGRIAGQVMSGLESEFTGYVPSHRLKVAGINVVSIGNLNKDGNYQEKVLLDDDNYVKVIADNDQKIGAIIVGQYSEQNKLLAEIRK